ncbi:hypothetical protein DEJ46_18920 [Streptomyces venezuelae]|uniref:Uncharacterized protein n=1 Tax=Streptomyces venezuelae TaxID=54571 RepID=A0A5P2ASC5_STRVZ|nr:hypothetical protein DEJ46_18920 [Streptomyces venezuelae]
MNEALSGASDTFRRTCPPALPARSRDRQPGRPGPLPLAATSAASLAAQQSRVRELGSAREYFADLVSIWLFKADWISWVWPFGRASFGRSATASVEDQPERRVLHGSGTLGRITVYVATIGFAGHPASS